MCQLYLDENKIKMKLYWIWVGPKAKMRGIRRRTRKIVHRDSDTRTQCDNRDGNWSHLSTHSGTPGLQQPAEVRRGEEGSLLEPS